MDFIRKIKESPHYERLKNSDQYRFDKRQCIIIGALTAFYGLACLLPMLSLSGPAVASAALVVIFFLVFFCMFVYYTYQWLEIFLHMEHYTFCQVKMDRIHVHGRGMVRFTVEFTDRSGKTQTRDTAPMFSSEWKPYVEDYNNKMALVGYNEKTDRLIVIKPI